MNRRKFLTISVEAVSALFLLELEKLGFDARKVIDPDRSPRMAKPTKGTPTKKPTGTPTPTQAHTQTPTSTTTITSTLAPTNTIEPTSSATSTVEPTSTVEATSTPTLQYQQTITIPQNGVISNGEVFEDFESHASFTLSGAGSYKADNIIQRVTGTQSVRVSAAVGVTTRLSKASLHLDLSANKLITMWVYYEGANLSYFHVWFGQDGDVINRFMSPDISGSSLTIGWNKIRFAKPDFVASGTPDWNAPFTNLRIEIFSTAGGAAVLSFDSLAIGEERQPMVLLSFDDSDASVYTEAYSYMLTHGMKGTFYVVTSWVNGMTGRVTVPQLTEMYNDGWDISNHTRSHTNLSGITESQVVAAVQNGAYDLDAWGFTRSSKHVAYPAGAHDETTLRAMSTAGMLTGRTIEEISQSQTTPATFPISDPYHINVRDSAGSGLTLEAANSYVDTYITRQEVLHIYLHVLAPTSADSITWAVSNFRQLIDYIALKKIPVLTISEFHALNFGPVDVKLPT